MLKIHKSNRSTFKQTSHDDDDDESDMPGELPNINMPMKMVANKYYSVYGEKKINIKSIYHIYIVEQIDESSNYTELYTLLKSADENTEINIYINSPGGYLSTAVQICQNIKLCKGMVICHAEQLVASAATLIFLSGMIHVVHNDATFMLHNYSGGAFGKGNELEAKIKYDTEYIPNLMYNYYKGFLSDAEFAQMREGKDFYFDSKEVLKRLKRRADAINSTGRIKRDKDGRPSLDKERVGFVFNQFATEAANQLMELK